MKNRWTAMLLLICLVFSLAGMCSPALAESYTVYVASNTLKVYQKASSSAKLLGTMSYGEKMTCTAVKDDWAQVKNGDGNVGYCKRSSLTTENPNTLDEQVFINRAGAKVYKKPSTSAEVMLKVSDTGSTYTAVAVTEDGDWVRLKNGKYYGYAQVKYVSPVSDRDAAADMEKEEDKKEESEEVNRKVYVAANTLKVFKTSSTSSKQLGVMSYGESMTLVKKLDDEWAQVRNSSGAEGYCKLSGLTAENPNKVAFTAFATENKVRIYLRPDTSVKQLGRLNEGEGIDVIAVTPDEQWARVEMSDGQKGYVQVKYLSLEEASEKEDEAEDFYSTAYISTGIAKVYAEPDTDSKLLGNLAYGEETTLLSVNDGWAKIQNASGNVGYIHYGALTAENPNSYNKTIYAAREVVKAYARPDVDSGAVAELSLNETMTLVAVVDGEIWGRVLLSSGDFAYVMAEECAMKPVEEENVSPEPPASDNNDDLAGDASAANAIIALAKEQLGDPYIYSASGPDSFDCSGLSYYCFKEITGIKLKRTAYAQGYDESYKKITDASDLKAGDLVFFNTNSADSDLSDHSGIYIGGGKFIHASSAAARVITSDLSSGYYQRTFSWGRRVL